MTPLHIAAMFDKIEGAKMLMESNRGIKQGNQTGNQTGTYLII